MKSYIIYIIRGGATREETEGKYIGHTDVELSEEGRKQLENMRSELLSARLYQARSSAARTLRRYSIPTTSA